MNHTANMNLPQWEASDRILRSDFNAAMSAIDAASVGNAKIAIGSYVGTGSSDSSEPNTLSFDFEPIVVFLDTHGSHDKHYIFYRGCTVDPIANRNLVISWSGNSVSWYYNNSDVTNPSFRASGQLNTNNHTYHYIAIGR